MVRAHAVTARVLQRTAERARPSVTKQRLKRRLRCHFAARQRSPRLRSRQRRRRRWRWRPGVRCRASGARCGARWRPRSPARASAPSAGQWARAPPRRPVAPGLLGVHAAALPLKKRRGALC